MSDLKNCCIRNCKAMVDPMKGPVCYKCWMGQTPACMNAEQQNLIMSRDLERHHAAVRTEALLAKFDKATPTGPGPKPTEPQSKHYLNASGVPAVLLIGSVLVNAFLLGRESR